MLNTFDDEWLRNVFAVSVLDGEGNDDRRAARICATVNTTALNVARRQAVNIPDEMYRTEADYMPTHSRQKEPQRTERQTWGEMKNAIGF